MSPEDREALAREWHALSDHAADGQPYGGWLCNCESIAGRVEQIVARHVAAALTEALVALDHKATEATERYAVSDAPEHLATWNAFEEAAQTIRNLANP